MYENIKGRALDDVPYVGLLERLNMILLICNLATEQKEAFSAADLLNMIADIHEKAVEAIAFSGATREETNQVFKTLLDGLSVSRINPS